MSSIEEKYSRYRQKMRSIADIKYAAAVLQWDQETYLPESGNEHRGQQIATLTEIAHEQFTAEATGQLLEDLLSQKDKLQAEPLRNVELSFEDYQKNKKLPTAFVREQTEAIQHSFHAWIAARKANNFEIFAVPLQKVIDFKRQEAELLGYQQHPYDALMNEFDRGLTVAFTDQLFEKLRNELTPLLQHILFQPPVNNQFLHQHFSKEKQWAFGMELLQHLHFDFKAGRQDISEHPFTTNFSAKDVRITTRIDENDFANMTWSCIHECGHALYEQGLPDEHYGLPLGEYCSLSIHESQSRLWENCIGRSREFWSGNWNLTMKYFSDELKEIDTETFFKGINRVTPSLIRTEADELTYHFHVMIRYEIEKMLIEGRIQSKEIPALWNALYQQYLGIVVPDDKNGCLQDVHWSHGSFGYFATYSIGSLYAAQFWGHIKKETPSIKTAIAKGDTTAVFNWLQKNIYQSGRFFSSSELCQKATGEILNPDYFIQYAKEKFSDIYSY